MICGKNHCLRKLPEISFANDLFLHLYCQHLGLSWRAEGTWHLEHCQKPATPATSQEMSSKIGVGVTINLDEPGSVSTQFKCIY